ncbi:hypothetical protein D3C76_1466180 [compost metagenome]
MVLRQQLAAAVHPAEDLEDEVRLPFAHSVGAEQLIERFELGLCQFVLLAFETQARHSQLPEEAVAAALGAFQPLLELLYGGLQTFFLKLRDSIPKAFLPGG